MKNTTLQSLARHFQQIIQNPQNYEAVFEVGLIHYQQEQYQEALSHFTKTYEKNYKTSSSAQYIGNIHFYTQQHNQAISWYQVALKTDPNNDSLYNSLGVIYKKLGKIQQAVSFFQKCLQINPRNSLAHYAIANVHYDLKSYEKALQHYELSIESNPKYDAPYVGRGNVYKKKGNFEEASKEYLKSLYLNPKNQAALSNLQQLPNRKKNDIDLKLSSIEKSFENKSDLSKSFITDKSDYEKYLSDIPSSKKTGPIIRRSAIFQQQKIEAESKGFNFELGSLKQQLFATISQMGQKFKQSIATTVAQKSFTTNVNSLKNNEDLLSARDKELSIQIDPNFDLGNLKQVQIWIQKVMNEVISASFNFYLNNQMTYHQARIYCCEKILTSIYLLISKRSQTIQPAFINKINKFMEEALEYIKSKYPLNQELEVPYKLQQIISSNKRDNTDSIEYDYFSHFPYQYEFRESGIYNDVIMKMINNLINTTNTNYYTFKQTMTKLFENVFEINQKKQQKGEEKNINQSVEKYKVQSVHRQKIKQNHLKQMLTQPQMIATSSQQISLDLQKIKSVQPHSNEMVMSQTQLSNHQTFFEKRRKQHKKIRELKEHRQKVQAYTSYVIKRKIPQFVKCYSDEEIRNINVLKIKDKSIFRILTKWCQQLWQKFDQYGYYLNKNNVVMLKDKKLFYLSLDYKEQLNSLIEEEKSLIKKFIEKISKDCNMKMQFRLFTRWLQDQNQLQNNTGIFTVNVVQSLEYFTVSYLNRLIHGLLKVSKKFSSRMLDETHPQLLLLTFRIKDLLRCRFKSKQEQSQKVLFHILQEAGLTVLRIKNRLNDNNNDIMINLFFEKMICEIQLAVQTNTSKFIECSNNFNHFLYQLERSYFGPITELSNIWYCHDKRMKHYKKLEQKRIQSFKQKANNCLHLYQKYSDDSQPFICNSCNRIYYHYNYIVPHKICLHCKSVSCGNCELTRMDPTKLKKHLKIDFIRRYTNWTQPFPQLSYFLIKECNQQQFGVYYITYTKRCKQYLISIKNHLSNFSFELITELMQKSIKNLLKKYVILQIPHNYQQILFEKKIEQTLLTSYIKESLEQEKDQISLCDFTIADDELKNIIKEEIHANQMSLNHYKVKKLIIDRINQGKIKKENIDYIVSEFANLQYLWIANNELDHLPRLSEPQKMIMINLQKTQLKDLQKNGHFQKLTNLQFLIIKGSHIKEIPLSLKVMTSLVHLQICNSNIKNLHESLFRHIGLLKYLNLSVNKLEKLPDSIKDLKKLQYLNVSENSLLQFPSVIIYNIQLVNLYLNDNILRFIPKNLQNLINLEHLDLSNCSLNSILAEFSYFGKLKKVILSSNKLHNLQFLSNSKINKEIILSHSCQQNIINASPNSNQLQTISNCQRIVLNSLPLGQAIEQIKFCNIKELIINDCNITFFPDIHQCHFLTLLDFSYNWIQQILPQDFEGLNMLQELILNENPIEAFPDNLQQLEKLVSLQLQNCGLREFPRFKKMNRMANLKIGNNYFSRIPDRLFESMPNLICLDIKNNKVEEIGQAQDTTSKARSLEIGQKIETLQNLKELYLGNCFLSQIPNIYQCRNLTVLRLQQNNISCVPDKLQKLEKLKVLRLDGNHFSKLKNIQLLNVSFKILPSIVILQNLLKDYAFDEEDQQQRIALARFATRFCDEIGQNVLQRQRLLIKKYGKSITKGDTFMVYPLLKIQSEYVVVQEFLAKIAALQNEQCFCKKYLDSIRQNLIIRLSQVENQQLKLLQKEHIVFPSYQPCYKLITLNPRQIKIQQTEINQQSIEVKINQLIKKHSALVQIFEKPQKISSIVLQSFKQILLIAVTNSLPIQINIRYYLYLKDILLPINIQEKGTSDFDSSLTNEKLLPFCDKYSFYTLNTLHKGNKTSEKLFLASSIEAYESAKR